MISQVIYDNDDKDGSVSEVAKSIIKDIENGTIYSCLGGPVEGIVIKRPNFISLNGILSYRRQKFVTSKFQEQHQTKGRKHNKRKKGKENKDDENKQNVIKYGETFATEARFVKSHQRLVANFHDNIKPLMDDLDADLLSEHKDAMIENVWKCFEDDLNKAYDSGIKCFENIRIDNDLRDTEHEKIKDMLFIEFLDELLRGVKKRFW